MWPCQPLALEHRVKNGKMFKEVRREWKELKFWTVINSATMLVIQTKTVLSHTRQHMALKIFLIKILDTTVLKRDIDYFMSSI